MAYLVAVNIHDVEMEVDFQSVFPGVPEDGIVVVATSADNEPAITQKG